MDNKIIFWQARIVLLAPLPTSNSSLIEVTVEFKDRQQNAFTEKFYLKTHRGRNITEQMEDLIKRLQDRLEDMDKVAADIDEIIDSVGIVVTQNGVFNPEIKVETLGLKASKPILK